MNLKNLVQNLFNVGLLGFVFVPLLALSFYNHPSAADDYCYIDTVFKYGYFEAMHYYYTGWTGRYFGILINHSNPLIFRWIEGFKIIPILLLLELVANFYALIKDLFKGHSWLVYLGMAGVVFFLFIFKMAAIPEAFYWMAAFVTYTVPNIMTIYWLVVIMRWYKMEQGWFSNLTALLLSFLIFAVIGSSETNLTLMVLLVVSWFGYQLLINRTFDKKALFLVLIAAFSCFVFFSSVGNTSRIDDNPLSRNIPYSLLQSLKLLAFLVFDWLRHTPLLIFTILFIFWLQNHFKKNPENAYLSVHPFWAGLGFVGILIVKLFPSFYGIGIQPTPRVINSVYLFFLLGWFYNVAVWVYFLKSKIAFSIPENILIKAVLVLPILYMTYFGSTNFRTIYNDWLRGGAAAYNQELYDRYALIQNTKSDTVYVKPLIHKPLSLFVEDLNDNPKHLWNRCSAGYFGKTVIALEKP